MQHVLNKMSWQCAQQLPCPGNNNQTK